MKAGVPSEFLSREEFRIFLGWPTNDVGMSIGPPLDRGVSPIWVNGNPNPTGAQARGDETGPLLEIKDRPVDAP